MDKRLGLDAQNPWPGLATFGERDQDYFRGRRRESDELTRLVRRERLTVLFGRSGLGKSSLLHAGLFPRLREDLHLPVYLRIDYAVATSPRQQVLDALNEACISNGVKAMPPEPDESLWAYFHRAGAGFWNPRRRPLLPVLVFDQFEEIFTLGQMDDSSRGAADDFIEELADLIEDRPSESLQEQLDDDPALGEQIDFDRRGCKVLLSFREDFLADVEGLRGRMPSLMRNRFRLLPMDGAQALEVIGSGGDIVGAEVADRIVGLAWRNRTEAPLPEEVSRIEVDPALLSVICSELNLRRLASGAATITSDLLAGAEREILVDFYERSLQGLDPSVRHFVEDELITATGYRDSRALDDALARPGVTSEALEKLVAGRLLGVDERFGVRRLELTHDVLTRVVMDSRDQRHEREARDLAEYEREQAHRAAQETERRLRKSRRVTFAATATAIVASVLLVLFGEAFYWAKKNELPTSSMWTLQLFRLTYAPVPEMVAIPAGDFYMGEQNEAFIYNGYTIDEYEKYGIPGQQNIAISKGLSIGIYEVTYDEFDYYVWLQHRDGKDDLVYPLTGRGGRESRPVVNVNWGAAMGYAIWLGDRTDKKCSLPTEAQWEFAARAKTETGYWWGSNINPTKDEWDKVTSKNTKTASWLSSRNIEWKDKVAMANCIGCGSDLDNVSSSPVGSFPPNRFGLYDTSGNVKEWTCSTWSKAYNGKVERECAKEKAEEKSDLRRVTRNGSYKSVKSVVRSSRRELKRSDLSDSDLGFRVLCQSYDK